MGTLIFRGGDRGRGGGVVVLVGNSLEAFMEMIPFITFVLAFESFDPKMLTVEASLNYTNSSNNTVRYRWY